MTPSNSAVLAAIEALYAKARTLHADAPEAVFILPTNEGSRKPRNGHFGASRWKPSGYEGDAYYAEIAIFAERLQDGADLVAETVLHELAHGLALVRAIKDTTRKGAYHNKKFKALAEEVGLIVDQNDQVGFGVTSLAPDTLAPYRAEVDALHEAIQAYRAIPTSEPVERKPSDPEARWVKMTCPDHEDVGVKVRQRDLPDAADSLTCWVCGGGLEAPPEEGEEP